MYFQDFDFFNLPESALLCFIILIDVIEIASKKNMVKNINI